ncbi:VRR-NUC domain-containing protein [Gordonia sp. 852002-10350_SCH5691597]|uniref:VRR-NUC domain-containing protein n=1 Tax=Gordonia sp. 852002-10350_SCH5691597 TaxID=1834085 RepID=UPI0007EA6C92|nr:VRR-NUC domain-containing protein [Gordonia sp. 852002-10350_SCH5691597]OBA61362.1 nuclease [Gordonia sp. 852002-10350_SCH5691597]
MAGRPRPLERTVERHLVDRCRELGVACFKFVSPGHAGVPDRLLLGHDARGAAVTLFVEVKRPGEKPRPSQVGMITTMRDHGAHVVVADSRTAVDALLDDYFVHPSVPIAERDPHDAPLPGQRPHVLVALQP